MPKVSVKITGLPMTSVTVANMQEGREHVKGLIGALEDKDYRIQWQSKRQIDNETFVVSATLQNRDNHKYAKISVAI